MPRALGDKRGFTLTELLVVVGILVLLTAIVVPNLAGRLTVARMHAAEDQISEIEAALAAYYADFGTYPSDVFPTEDKNNDGVLDAGEDTGVDVDGDGGPNGYDYACNSDGSAAANGRLDRGDGVVNIDDLEWALRTTAKNGPYMDGIPLDPWGSKYVYVAPLTRPTYNSNDPNDNGNTDYLYFDPADTDTPAEGAIPARTLCTEDANGNGRLEPSEDVGIAVYDTAATDVSSGFTSMRAGAGNGILDHGDDDNQNSDIETYIDMSPPVAPVPIELGNKDVSPDGLARNLGYYIYSIGRNKKDETATGYEDINLNSILNDSANPINIDGGTFDEDLDGDGSLDTGYEDTGIDGIPGTKDNGEDDGKLTVGTGSPPPDETFSGRFNKASELDIGGDDINSWNKATPWRSHSSYGG